MAVGITGLGLSRSLGEGGRVNELYSPLMSSSRVIRVGVLGAGAWANFAHLPGFKRDPRCEVVAIADPQADLAQRRGQRVRHSRSSAATIAS